jgi:predicted Zn-dependent protease
MWVFFILLALERFAFGIELVRDAEIEDYLYDISQPIFKSASLEKNAVKFYLVKENSINAFVYGGSNIFVHTGLIENSNTPNMLEGVIAHELGHIMGAHLVKMEPQIMKALATYAVSTLLGVGMLAGGGSMSATNAAIATTLLGQQIAERGFLSFSRSQESEADRYAMLFLGKASISSEGMLELFTKLETIQKKYTKEMDKYSVTHPLTKERFEYFKTYAVKGSDSLEFMQRHRFIQAKILAYSKSDNIFTSAKDINKVDDYKTYYLTYKNIVEYKYATALKLMKGLINKYPQNPYFHETIATIYLNLNNNEEAKKHFNNAIQCSNGNLLIKAEYATFLIKSFDDPYHIQQGVFILEELKNTTEANALLYQNLQFAYNKLNMEDYNLLHRIEELAFFGDTKKSETKERVLELSNHLQILLKKKPNSIISERLRRIKQIL